MNSRFLWFSLFGAMIAALLFVAAKSPSPAPRTTITAAPPRPAPTPTPHPALSPSEELVALVHRTPAANTGQPPKPLLYLTGMEAYSTGGKNYIRLLYDVLNKADYPADMFAAAPGLPPCGSTTNASRTWVDFFDAAGTRIYGFCNLSKPEDLGKIWIAYEQGTIPPSYVYIELNDRQTNTNYKSNLADTTL